MSIKRPGAINYHLVILGFLVSITVISGMALITSNSYADSFIDDVDISVPVSCTMSGTGMTSHNDSIINGSYSANIGTTTLHAFCNDNGGFAIYATGYTGNTIKETNSNKLIGANTNTAIDTGLATSAGNPDVSNWAMKLALTQDSGDTTGTNAAVIDSDTEGPFSAYHTVPNEFTKVAHKNAATDLTETIGGVKLATSYAAYISKAQPSDTYSGQVIYVLVHPSTAPTPKEEIEKTIALTYDGGVLYFDSEKTQHQNTVTYSTTCEKETLQYDVVKTSNLADDGTQNNNPYIQEDLGIQKKYIGADKVKIVVDYGITANTGGIYISDGNWEQEYDILPEEDNLSGTQTFILDGDSVSIYISIWDTENLTNGYDYGAYVKIYPLDENGDEISFTHLGNCHNWTTLNGAYAEPLTYPGDGHYQGACWFIYWNLPNEPSTEQEVFQSIDSTGIDIVNDYNGFINLLINATNFT